MMGKYYVVDLETTVRNTGDEAIGKFAADPHSAKNHVVLYACKPEAHEAYVGGQYEILPPPDDMDLLVGQNVAFDILYLIRRNEEWRNWFFSPKSKIWDTMIAEYILSGQETKYAKLDYLSLLHGGAPDKDIDFWMNKDKFYRKAQENGNEAVKKHEERLNRFISVYGSFVKDDKIKDYWDKGYQTEDIPPNELEEYAVFDVINTERVFLSQLEIADQQGQTDLIMSMMESRMATISMEFDGFAFDKEGASCKAVDIDFTIDVCNGTLSKIVDRLVDNPHVIIDVGSAVQLSKVIFGGIHKYRAKVAMTDEDGNEILYKSGAKKGQVRYRNDTFEIHLDGVIDSNAIRSTKKLKNGSWKLDDETVRECLRYLESVILLKNSSQVADVASMLITIQKVRAHSKDLTAFYRPYIALTWPSSGIDYGILHPRFSHTATDTGRLSCSAPNIQQSSGGD